MTRASGNPLPERCLILVRHGLTVWNTEGRYTTRSDIPPSEEGIEQARAAAAALAATRIDRVFCSPLGRARRTGEIIASAQRGSVPPVVVDERLTEIDAGPFEGLTAAEINAGPLAEAHTLWHSDTDPVTPAGAETLESAHRRAAAFYDDVSGLGGTTLAATHGSLARVLVASVVLTAPPAAHRRLWLDNCHWVVIQLDRRPRMVAFNHGPSSN
jgi:broad specificity phosphatase PhoE